MLLVSGLFRISGSIPGSPETPTFKDPYIGLYCLDYFHCFQ